jgi:hypothetical protein
VKSRVRRAFCYLGHNSEGKEHEIAIICGALMALSVTAAEAALVSAAVVTGTDIYRGCEHFERSQWRSSARYVDDQMMISPAGLLRGRLDVEDTHARNADHTDDPSAARRLKWWPIPDRDAA